VIKLIVFRTRAPGSDGWLRQHVSAVPAHTCAGVPL
jgi:hypothetical protein